MFFRFASLYSIIVKIQSLLTIIFHVDRQYLKGRFTLRLRCVVNITSGYCDFSALTFNSYFDSYGSLDYLIWYKETPYVVV